MKNLKKLNSKILNEDTNPFLAGGGNSDNNPFLKGGKNTTTVDEWAKCLIHLTDFAKLKDKDIYRKKYYNGDKILFYENGELKYVYKNGTVKDGTWKCNGENGFLVELSDGQKWDGTKWTQPESSNSSGNQTDNTGGGEYQALESGAYTTKGDPYQYKVVNGKWYTKSWKNRGKKIRNWVSLENNQNATNELDRRHPGVRVGKQGNEKFAEYAKQFSKDGKFGQELERLKSLGIKTSELLPADYRKYLTNPALSTGDNTTKGDNVVTPPVDIKTTETEISGPVNTINPADTNF